MTNSLHTQHEFITFDNHYLHSLNQIKSKIYIVYQKFNTSFSFTNLHVGIMNIHTQIRKPVLMLVLKMSETQLQNKLQFGMAN